MKSNGRKVGTQKSSLFSRSRINSNKQRKQQRLNNEFQASRYQAALARWEADNA